MPALPTAQVHRLLAGQDTNCAAHRVVSLWARCAAPLVDRLRACVKMPAGCTRRSALLTSGAAPTGGHPASAVLAAGVKMRCVLHTVISNVHIVGCSQGQVSPYGFLFEGGRGHVEIQISQCWGFYLDTGEPQKWWSRWRSLGSSLCGLGRGVHFSQCWGFYLDTGEPQSW